MPSVLTNAVKIQYQDNNSKAQSQRRLSKIDTPFLAEAYNDIVIVKQMSKDGNFIYDWYGQEMKNSSEDFKKEATGIMFI